MLAMSGSILLADGQSMFNPASPGAESINNLAILVLAITGLIFIIVEGVLLHSVLRFRRRAVTGKEPPQVYGSKPIEIAWTAAPALIVFVLVLVTARTLWEVNVPPPVPREGDNTLFVTVVGRQWWWEYQYDHYNGRPIRAAGADSRATDFPVITANELHVPASEAGVPRPVFLTLKSADVCHSFWVPRLSGKTDLIPGRTNYMLFHATTPGLYLGQCAEFCSTQHGNMLLRVRVEPAPAFRDWLAHEKKPATDKPSEERSFFLSQSCVSCHDVRGVTDRLPGHKRGNYGPDLTHLMRRETLASCMIPNDRGGDNLRAWVADPQKIKVGCLMPAFGLS